LGLEGSASAGGAADFRAKGFLKLRTCNEEEEEEMKQLCVSAKH
jgi:hypothetical protein